MHERGERHPTLYTWGDWMFLFFIFYLSRWTRLMVLTAQISRAFTRPKHHGTKKPKIKELWRINNKIPGSIGIGTNRNQILLFSSETLAGRKKDKNVNFFIRATYFALAKFPFMNDQRRNVSLREFHHNLQLYIKPTISFWWQSKVNEICWTVWRKKKIK